MNSHRIASSALATLMGLGVLPAAQAADEAAKEQCFGIAKAGANDCASLTDVHTCAGQAKSAKAADDWIYVAPGTCAKLGGKTLDQAKVALKK
jgi:uncharacterized membrane protein